MQLQDDLRNSIIYQILIDRFSGCANKKNSSDFLGGNLNGITEKLDYLSNLGINTIWLSPFYETDKYHGYQITDFKKVDPHFGSLDALQILINRAHKKKIKIIADFVPNHCSVNHPFFKDAQTNTSRKYRNWFYFNESSNDYLCFLDIKELPKLNLDNADTRNYILDVANYWLSLGIDGYRVDHVIGPSHDFWKCFYSNIKKNYPEAFLFGEAWGEGINTKYFKTLNFKNKLWRRIFGVSQEKLQLEYAGEFDGMMDFVLNKMLISAIVKDENLVKDISFRKKIEQHLKKYPENYFPILFLDNHDMNRFLRYCNGDTKILLQAFEFLLSLNKPVVIYYNTENGVCNNLPVTPEIPYSDLNVREAFDWNKIDIELYNKFRALILKQNDRIPL